MSQDVSVSSPAAGSTHLSFNGETQELLTVMLGNQIFGIPILQVQDVLGQQRVTRIPLSPPEVAGSLNLRGRIVTAINVRCRLNMDLREDSGENMSIVVEHDGELYSLIFDAVGDVLSLSDRDYEANPSTLDPTLLSVSDGIYRLDRQLLVVLDVPKMLRSIGVN